MQIVRKLCTVIFIFFISICSGQNILGTYQRIDDYTTGNDIGIQYHFDKQGNFKQIISKHLSDKRILKGKYSLVNDTLNLYYSKDVDSADNNHLEIIRKDKIETLSSKKKDIFLFTKIQIFDSEENVQAGAILAVRDKNKKNLIGFMSDDEGFFPDLNLYDEVFKEFQVSAMGKKKIIIPTDSLIGYRTKIKVYLENSGNDVDSQDTLKNFVIEKITKNKFELISLKNRKKIILKRIK